MPVPTNKTLFRNVSILDSTGADPYPGDVLVDNDRIAAVGTVEPGQTEGARVIEGRGRTLMSGLCDAHTHFSWNNSADLDGLGTMPVEEHLLFCLESARTYIDSGYTMCLGAASAKDRLDVVCRDAINAGRIPGPRYLANGPEIAVTGGALIKSITKFADGPEGMRQAVRQLIDLGVDQIKLSMTGEEITGTQRAEDTYFSDEEIAAAVTEAHRRGKRVCAHARCAESVKMCLRNKRRHHLPRQLHRRRGHGHARSQQGLGVRRAGHQLAGRHPLRGRGVRVPAGGRRGRRLQEGTGDGHRRAARDAPPRRQVLPGGDYGFAWTPHGTYARDLQHFVELLGFTPMEAITAATALGGEIMLRPTSSGKVQPGYLADLLLVDGDPLADITILQDHDKLHYIMKDGKFHKEHAGDERTRPGPRPTGARHWHEQLVDASVPDTAPEADTRMIGVSASRHLREPTMTLLICRTCPRYDDPANGEFRRASRRPDRPEPRRGPPSSSATSNASAAAPMTASPPWTGPARPASGSPDCTPTTPTRSSKPPTPTHACPTGAPEDWDIPAELVDHISTITYKPTPLSPAPSNPSGTTPFVWRRGAA